MTGETLDQDQVWQAIDAQRLSLADLLDDLSDEEWCTPSLCEGWTVRDVAAHLTLQQRARRAAGRGGHRHQPDVVHALAASVPRDAEDARVQADRDGHDVDHR